MTKANDTALHRLEDMIVEEVSFVDRGANKRKFAVVKRDTGKGSAMAEQAAGAPASIEEPDAAKAQWSAKYVNDLPDSAFLYVEAGGEKDEDGRTVPRTLRHFPVKDVDGNLDLPHVRNALARIPQSTLADDVKDKATAKAKKLLEEATKAAEEKRADEGGTAPDAAASVPSTPDAEPAAGTPAPADSATDPEALAKAGQKIKRARLDRLKELHSALSELIQDLEPDVEEGPSYAAKDDGGADPAPIQMQVAGGDVVAKIADAVAKVTEIVTAQQASIAALQKRLEVGPSVLPTPTAGKPEGDDVRKRAPRDPAWPRDMADRRAYPDAAEAGAR